MQTLNTLERVLIGFVITLAIVHICFRQNLEIPRTKFLPLKTQKILWLNNPSKNLFQNYTKQFFIKHKSNSNNTNSFQAINESSNIYSDNQQ